MVSGVAPACGVWMLACVLPAREGGVSLRPGVRPGLRVLPAREGGVACRATPTPRLPSSLKLLSSRSATPRQATEIKRRDPSTAIAFAEASRVFAPQSFFSRSIVYANARFVAPIRAKAARCGVRMSWKSYALRKMPRVAVKR